MTVCLSISTVLAALHVLEILWTTTKLLYVLVEEPEQVEKDTTFQKKEAEQLDFEPWPDFRHFRIWGTNSRSEVSSCGSRSSEAIARINETESAKSTADLTTSYTITRAMLQTNFEVLDSRIASGLKKNIDGDCKRRVFIQEEAAQKEKRFVTGRQVAWMICAYFKISGTHESVLDVNEILWSN